jgi:uncharacterized repeat protein (TIGR03803 family)
MRVVYLRTAIALAALSVAGSALAAPAETVLYRFQAGASDGDGPAAGLIADEEGALYGTTRYGGSSGNGTVFKLTPPVPPATQWIETVLYSFCSLSNCSDGSNPQAGLIFGREGALYGTTYFGGSGNCSPSGAAPGCGTVFKLTPSEQHGKITWTESVLYTFKAGPSDGSIFPLPA